MYARLEILLRNWLAGSKPVVSISRDATVHSNLTASTDIKGAQLSIDSVN